MKTISIYEAKTHLSRYLDRLSARLEDEVVISRRGRPVARIVPISVADSAKRIGLAKGRFRVPDNIDQDNPVIAGMFAEMHDKSP